MTNSVAKSLPAVLQGVLASLSLTGQNEPKDNVNTVTTSTDVTPVPTTSRGERFYNTEQQRGILSALALDLSFDECSRWCAPAQSPPIPRRSLEDENKVVRDGCANKVVNRFASVHVCTNFYCKRDGKCRKVEAWVYNLREKVLRDLHSAVSSQTPTWKPVLVSLRKHRETFVKPAEKLSSITETMGRHFTTLVFF